MKKYGRFVAIIGAIGLIFASTINSWLFFNQPKTPKMLSK